MRVVLYKEKKEQMATIPKILIVEDSYFNQVLLESLLSSWGFETILCKDVEDALVILQDNNLSLILLDIMLPGLDGFDFLINKRKSQNNTPVIAISAKTDDHTIARAKELGALHFIKKPIDTNELLSTISIYLNKKAN